METIEEKNNVNNTKEQQEENQDEVSSDSSEQSEEEEAPEIENKKDHSIEDNSQVIKKDKEKKKIIINTTIKKFIASENLDMGVTCSFYADINFPLEKMKGILNKNSNHGLTGLKNLGNTAYINSIIQCLSNCPDLVYYYISGVYLDNLNKKILKQGVKPGALSRSFSSLLSKMWVDNNKIVSPIELQYLIGELMQSHKNKFQHDASEFLLRFLNILIEESRKEEKGTIFYEQPKHEGESDISASKRFWNLFKKEYNSVITNLFYGQMRNVIRCLSCGNSETKFEEFSILFLEIPILKKISVLLVPSNNIKSTVEINLYISDSALFIDIGTYIKQYLNSGFENYRVLLFNYNTSSVKFVKMSENIYNTSKKGMIVIYEIGDSIYNSQDEDNEEDEFEDYFPFITIVKKGNFDKENNSKASNFCSYPRIFPINSYSKIKALRVKIFGYLRKYYQISDKVKISQKYNEIYSNFNSNNNMEIYDSELISIYEKEYNYIFNCNNNNYTQEENEVISYYLEKFPFKCYLSSPKPENEDKIFFSNTPSEYQKDFPDNLSIKTIIDYARKGYKIILYITDPSYIPLMNQVTLISSQEKKKTTLNDCLIHFTLHDKMEKGNEWYCPKCRKFQNAYKKVDLFYLPKYLIISLKRYQRTYLSKTKVQLLKNNEHIDFPVNGVSFEKFICGIKVPKPLYELYAVSQHSGSIEGGHYASACKNLGKWYLFDDASFFLCDDDMINTPEGYIFFYKKVKEKIIQ